MQEQKTQEKQNFTVETIEIIKKYSNVKDSLLLVLESVQEKFNFVPRESMIVISSELKIPLSKVYSVVTFYNELKTVERGKHIVRVCLGTACSVKHNHANLEFLKSLLNIEPGSTTKDKLITLETVNCFGACSMAPIVEVDGKLIGRVTKEELKRIIESLK